AREALCRLIGVPDADSERMIFTKNATEAINIVLLGIVQPGDTVVTSSLEHNAVMRPLRWLEKTRGAKILVIRCDGGGTPDRADLAAALARSPHLAVFAMASNVSGALLPWEELAHRFRKAGSLVCLDASQA
ncbi:MAG TPA: cysteine desulfurase, partial [Spirochaetaceae bacterium]|nr:cysteine desulfurase [Spirochaetaceae bacterium]